MAEGLVRRLRHPRLGFVFSTSHAYALWPAERVVAQLRDAAPRMMSFNVCGCRRAEPVPPAPCLNLPLDEGDLDLAGIFEALSAGAYRGDIIVQGYGWRGDIPSLLRRSAEACRQLLPTFSL
jgi:sugar phosphate isomerase/epimerase